MNLRAWLSRFRPRAEGILAAPPPEWFLLHPWLNEAGVLVNSDNAIQVSAVYGCCRLIVDCLAPASIITTEIGADGVREDRHDDPVGWTLNYGAPVAIAPDAPPAQAIEEALYWSALLGDGNGYAEIQWDGAGRFFALWPIESDRVTPRRDERGFYYEIRQPKGGLAWLPATSMFHLHGPSLRGWIGDSIVYRAAKAIGIAHAAQVYSAAYFANGTVVSGLLTSDKLITEAQADRAKERWDKTHKGPGKAQGIGVVGQGIKYQPINHNAQESQLVEARRFQVQEIARFYGVPTTLLADNEAWTNLSELYRGFYQNALRPWAERFDAEATRKLFPQRKPWREVQHDLEHLTLGSFKEKVAALVQATGNKPIWTQNEARAVFGKNNVQGGDVLGAAPIPTSPPRGADEPMRPDRGNSEDHDPSMRMAVALEDHARRVRARRADLMAKGLPERDIARHVVDLRKQARSEMRGLMKGLGLGIREANAAIEAVEEGVPPEKAAQQLTGSE